MPRIDPMQLLTCLNILLDDNGGILSEAETNRLAGLMNKYSKKLVSKCIYIQILKCTQTELLGQFMSVGGWSLTHLWLTDAIRVSNWPLVQEILELLLSCPVDVQRLKSNSAPKLVKQLCTSGGSECVRILADRLVQQWLNVVKGENLTIPSKIESDQTVSTTTNIPETEAKFLSANSSVDENTETSPQLRKLSTDSTSSATAPGIKMIIVKDGKKHMSKIETSPVLIKSGVTEENTTEQPEVNEQESKDSTDFSKKSESDVELSEKDQELLETDRKLKELYKDSNESSKSKHKSSKDKRKSSNHNKTSNSSKSSSKSSSSTSSSSSSKSKSSHNRSSSKDKDKEKDRSSDKDNKHKDKHKSSSSSKLSSKSKDKQDKKERSEKEKVEQAEKDKDTLSKIIPPTLDKLGKIPKKARDPNEKPDSPQPASIKIPSKKASISIEIRKDSEKSKTVKTYKSQFRSHGLTEEAPPPPSRKGLKKPTPTPTGTSIPSTIPTSGLNLPSLKRSSPSPDSKDNLKDSPPDKKLKIDLTSVPNQKPGAIKLIPAKPKPSSLVESDMFMDALSASAQPKKEVRKRKRRSSDSKMPLTAESKNIPSSPTVESPTKAAPLKFYQDTLEENKEDEQNSSKDEAKLTDDTESPESPPKQVKEDIGDKSEKEDDENNKENDEVIEVRPPGPGCGPNGPPGVLMLHRRRGPKKKLSWRPQEELEEIRYFEMDETERCNVSKPNFGETAQNERAKEREAFLKHRKLGGAEDLMVEKTTWAKLIIVDEVPAHPEGSGSREKKIQNDREQSTLKALYFSKAMIPDSPSEAEFEHISIIEPSVIPLDDVTGNPDAVNDYTKYDWPDPKPILAESAIPPPSSELILSGPGDLPFPGLPPANNQFNPFLPFGGNPQLSPNGPQPPVNMTPNMHMGPSSNMGSSVPNMIPTSNNMPTIGFNMPPNPGMMNNSNMMQGPINPFGGPPSFGPSFGMNVAPQMMNGGNFVGMNMPPGPRNLMNRPPIGPNMNNMVGMGNMGAGLGGWRPGNMAPNMPTGGGGNWRQMNGPSMNQQNQMNNQNNPRNWVHGNNNNRGVCKQFLRGNCRNGNRCNYFHPPKTRI